MADVFFHVGKKFKRPPFCYFQFFFTILLAAIAIHVLFKNHFVFLLSDGPKFKNRGLQRKEIFFQAATSSPDLDKNKQKIF